MERRPSQSPPSQPTAMVFAGSTDPENSSSSGDSSDAGDGAAARQPRPRLTVGVFSKHKGVRYHRDGQVRSCRFCEILRERAEEFLYEDEHMVVFRPLRPIVPSHVLIVPRAHIRNVNKLARHHRALLLRMKGVAESVVAKHFPNEAADSHRLHMKRRHGHSHSHDRSEPQHNDNADDQQDSDAQKALRVRSSFHVPPFNSIDHVHMHAFVDDHATLGYYGRIKYRTESWWCRSYDEVLSRLDHGRATADSGAATSSPQPEADGDTFASPSPELPEQRALVHLAA